MFGRILGHISKRTVHTVGFTLLAVLIAFFAATRTQVGRDELKRRLVRSFNDKYQGELSIGDLTGNLLYTLYATEVLLSGPDGSPIAIVDSVVIEPRWSDLIRRQFSVKTVSVHRPYLALQRTDSTRFSLSDALAERAPDTSRTASGWTFKSAAVNVHDGILLTENPPDQTGGDRTNALRNARFDHIDFEARVDWNAPDGQIDLLGYSADFDNGKLSIRGQPSQIVVQGERLSINDLIFQLGESTLSLSGFANVFQPGEKTDWWDVPFLLDLEAENVSFDELKTFIPASPLAGTADVAALIQGPLSNATISWLRFGNATSNIEVSGLVSDLPDSISYDLAIEAERVIPGDLRTWLPELRAARHFRMDSLSISGSVNGSYSMGGETPFISATGLAEVSSNRGAVTSSFELEGPLSEELAFDLSLASSRTDLAYWTRSEDLATSINGAVRMVGSGYRPDSLFAEFSVDLRNLDLGPAYLPTLTFSGQIEHGAFDTVLDAVQPNGGISLATTGTVANGTVTYESRLEARSFDLGPVLGNDSLTTAFNARGTVSGAGITERDLSGELNLTIDSSSVAVGDRTSAVRPHAYRLSIRRPDALGPRITLRGDVADVDVGGTVHLSALARLSRAWIDGVASAVREQSGKRLYDTGAPVVEEDDLRRTILWEDADFAVERLLGGQPANLEITGAVHALDILSDYSPLLPRMASAGSGSVTVVMSENDVAISGSYAADSLLYAGVMLWNARLRGNASASRDPSIADSFGATGSVDSDSLSASGTVFQAPHLTFGIRNRQGYFTARSQGSDRLDAIEFDSRIFLAADRTRLVLDRLRIDGSSTYWSNTDTVKVDLYGDALSVGRARFQQFGPDGPTGPSISASGLYSSQVHDTLHVQANTIALHELSRFVTLKPHLDGQVDAQLDVTGGGDRAAVTGDLSVGQFELDHHILGDLDVQSRFIPGSPDLDVQLVLSNTEGLAERVVYEEDAPSDSVSNRLEIGGTLRLPSNPRGAPADPGMLDLRVAIERADLFFLKYLFTDLEDLRGFATGSGRITGTPDHPLFDVALDLRNGGFRIPKFNLEYTLNGDLRIDREGIQIDHARIADRNGGTVDGSGSVLFNNYRFFSLDLDFVLDRFQIMNVAFSEELPFYGFLRASGTATLDGRISGATLRSPDATVTSNSELFIPVVESATGTDEAYIIFTDEEGTIPDFKKLTTRSSLLGSRPDAERRFLDALDMDLAIQAPTGSTVHLVIDPLLGDVINAKSTGNVQIRRDQGVFSIFGDLEVEGGDYLFTAGEVFVRKFNIEEGGTISWQGDPVNASLDIPASYRTRASLDGLPGYESNTLGLVPLIVSLQIGGTVESPTVELGLSIDRTRQNILGDYTALEAQLNSPDRTTEYATSVLLTNTFRLTTDSFGSGSGSQLAFNSVSQLVSSQVNRFVNGALPNVDFSFGLQGENAQDLDVTYGVALRLLDERLIIRGEGVYQGSRSNTDNVTTTGEGLQGEFQVEVRLSPTVSVEVFFRREGDILESDLTNTTGAGLSYQTEFSSWKKLWRKLFGWTSSKKEEPESTPVATDSRD